MTAANVIAIDPGYSARGEGCACAYVTGGYLTSVWFARSDSALFADVLPITPTNVVVEKPQQDSRSWGLPPSTLINLAWEGALLAGLYAGRFGGSVVAVTPSTWKGSVPKPVAHGRLWKVLTPAEREVLGGDDTARRIEAAKRKGALDRWGKPGVRYYPRTWGGHNLLDAAALALTHVGRLTK
jgi:hypothetical protein